MPDFAAGWQTDLEVLRHTGSTVRAGDGCLIVHSPHNPDSHWGNCLFVTDDSTLDDAVGWVARFRSAFPSASWIALELPRMPDDPSGWNALGIGLETDEALTSCRPPAATPRPPGYQIRRFTTLDWPISLAREIADNDLSGTEDPRTFARFARAQAAARQGLSGRDVAAFFGAFHGVDLVAALGVVRCGDTARYQSVGTDPDHRRRGLAAHLLGVAGQWSADHGCTRWVIVTEATNPAGRIYRRAGFEPEVGSVQAYRRPAYR